MSWNAQTVCTVPDERPLPPTFSMDALKDCGPYGAGFPERLAPRAQDVHGLPFKIHMTYWAAATRRDSERKGKNQLFDGGHAENGSMAGSLDR